MEKNNRKFFQSFMRACKKALQTKQPIKKILALVLAANILFSTSLAAATNETTGDVEIKDSAISDLLSLGTKSPLTGDETLPFNSAADSSILMSRENELLLYTSNKKGTATKDDFIKIFEKMDQDTSYTEEGNIVPELDLFFVSAVALKASDNGTDDHIAYLGVKVFDENDGGANTNREDEQVLMLVLYNARKKVVVDTIELGSVEDWAKYVEHYSYKTLFSVTAGDYDNDGVDEIACTDHDMGIQMIEINEDGSLRKAQRYDWTELVSKSVLSEMKKFVTSKSDVYRRAFFSLATGNFDGTGAEELAVAVSTNNPDDEDLLPAIPQACSTQIAILLSPLTDAVDIRTLSIHSTSKTDDEEEQDHIVHRVLYLGQITAGDLDGDRRDEIAIAGYTGRIEVDGDGNFVDEDYDEPYEYDEANIALCYAKLDGNRFGISGISVDAMTPFIAEGFFDSNETLVPLAIDAAKLHGQYSKESVFVGGKVYQFSGGEAAALYTHTFFESESSYVYTDAYVEYVTSGVFSGLDPYNDNKPMINEQFIFTVVEKDSGQNEYNYKIGFISASTNQETNVTMFSDNAAQMEIDGYLLEESYGGLYKGWGMDTNYGTALIPIAADIDEDGMLVKHTNTTYLYEDPSVEAILQAAPYFDELGSWNDFNGSTTYSVSVSRSLIDIWGYTHSIHAGFKGKVGEEDVYELELKIGYALDMDFEHERAYTSTYTTTFEAGSCDTVVVQRTPYVCYEYSFVDLNGNLLTGDDAGSVVFMEAMHPVYFQLSVDEYNQFVDEYNTLAERHDTQGTTADGKPVKPLGDSYRLVKITDQILPSNATGNPENYFSSINDGTYISKGSYTLGHNGGFTSSEFSYEIEESYSAVYAHGLHFEMEGVVDNVILGFIGAGAFAGLSFQETCGYGDATVNGTATGGTIANIIPSNYSEAEQAALKLYGFTWQCAMWKKSLMTDIYGNPYCDSDGNAIMIPVVGYVVSNVKSPMQAPTGVDAYLSGNGYQVNVDWTPFPNNSASLLGYYIYRTCDNQDAVQINTTPLPATASSFTDTTILKPGKIYTYHVAACYDNGNSVYLTMNSNSSTVVWGIPQLLDKITDETPNENQNNDFLVASVFGSGSWLTISVLVVLGVSAAAFGIIKQSKKKKSPVKSEEDD